MCLAKCRPFGHMTRYFIALLLLLIDFDRMLLQCHLSCWTEVLDKLDSILRECCIGVGFTNENPKWPILPVDKPEFDKKELLLQALSFSALLAENNSSVTEVYNSIEVSDDGFLLFLCSKKIISD